MQVGRYGEWTKVCPYGHEPWEIAKIAKIAGIAKIEEQQLAISKKPLAADFR
ncbi:MAG: hypothetical protein LAP21_09900 [Acidobacteriia bacterium]|nr:hypothetical protein [Terriglobia bacterium]